MWLLIAREPMPNAPYWRGRRLLATLDAAGWPLLWALMLNSLPSPVGIAGSLGAALAVLSALVRVHRALWSNHRYQFTTWRWARIAAVLVIAGALLKLTTAA